METAMGGAALLHGNAIYLFQGEYRLQNGVLFTVPDALRNIQNNGIPMVQISTHFIADLKIVGTLHLYNTSTFVP